jgi:hypothetical protein
MSSAGYIFYREQRVLLPGGARQGVHLRVVGERDERTAQRAANIKAWSRIERRAGRRRTRPRVVIAAGGVPVVGGDSGSTRAV